MSAGKCAYPEHHARRDTGLLAAAVLVLVAWKFRHVLLELVIWAGVVIGLALAAAAVVLAVRLVCKTSVQNTPPGGEKCTPGLHRWRPRVGLAAELQWARHLPRAAWCALRWHHLTRNLGLAYPDKHVQGKVRRPRAIVHPSRHGVTARVRAVPGSGREEFDQAAQHFADAWRVQRVSVSQPRPGRLVVRGLRRDPLLEHLEVVRDVKADIPHRLYLGRDEHGQDRYADLANVPGIAVGGMPGSGKSTEITSWIAQLAPSPAVQFVNLDGKGAGEFADFEPRAWLTGGDDLDEALGILEAVHGLMTDRLACVRTVLGTKNAWHAGPSEVWPLVVTTIDECQQYFDLTMVKGDRVAEPKVRRAIFLASSLVRRGRSVAMLTIPATQKPTTDSLPSSLRDNCPVAMSFAVRTTDAAVATLGSAIREYPSYSPAGLALPDYTGVATVTLRTGQDPFSRLRGPWVTEEQAAAVATATAHLRRDPRVSLPIVVPDDARDLDPETAGA